MHEAPDADVRTSSTSKPRVVCKLALRASTGSDVESAARAAVIGTRAAATTANRNAVFLNETELESFIRFSEAEYSAIFLWGPRAL
jgi:hypothetical protein